MKLLVTGGAGFIGSNFIKLIISETNWEVINLDKLTYAGNLENLAEIKDNRRHCFVRGDISDPEQVKRIFSQYKPAAVINFAAESHVDRSIQNAAPFITTNVLGTQVLLEASRQYQVDKYVQVSTDEVYGSLEAGEGFFTEETPLAPNSPYSASKASADLLCRAFHRTYRMPVVVTRCSNNFGPYQFPEKLIPLVITNALEGKPIPVYGDGLNVRDWIHVFDHCSALKLVIEKGRPGEVYNIGGGAQATNLGLIKEILSIAGQHESLLNFVKDRPGHDRHYAIDPQKIKNELDWNLLYDFRRGLTETVTWYINNKPWWERIKSGEYQQYYQEWYGNLR